MSKQNGKIKLISLTITLAVLLIGGVSGYVWTQADVRANTVKIENIDEHGSEPTKVNKTDIKLVKQDIFYIQRDIGEIRKEQSVQFDKILRKLDEK